MDHDEEAVDDFAEHLRLINLRDDLTEESDALIERRSKQEGLSVDLDNIVKQACKLGHDIDVYSVDEGVLDPGLQSLLNRLWQYHQAQIVN